jgi:hypothetical protein
MTTLIRCAALALALVASIPVTNAQSPVTQQPYEAFIVQPSGTLVAQMPFVTLPEGVIRPVQTVQTKTVQTIQPEHVAAPLQTVQTVRPEHAAPPVQTVQTVRPEHAAPPVQTVQTIQPEHVASPIARLGTVVSHHTIVHHVATAVSEHVAQPIARHRIVASQVIVHHVATAASSQPLYDYVALVPVERRIVTPVVIAPAPALAPGQVLNLSGQFQCVVGCAGGLEGTRPTHQSLDRLARAHLGAKLERRCNLFSRRDDNSV